MIETTPPNVLKALVDWTAMVLKVTPPEDALQALADALGAQTIAIARVDLASNDANVLAQNSRTSVVSRDGFTGSQPAKSHSITLQEGETASDILLIQDRMKALQPNLIKTVETAAPYLQAAWSSRTDAFDRALSLGRRPASNSILHPDNPYKLTPTERRVCALIEAGHRPATMAHTMNTSMPTVRTHLRSIYAKTGLDGMIGVMRHLQSHADQLQNAG